MRTNVKFEARRVRLSSISPRNSRRFRVGAFLEGHFLKNVFLKDFSFVISKDSKYQNPPQRGPRRKRLVPPRPTQISKAWPDSTSGITASYSPVVRGALMRRMRACDLSNKAGRSGPTDQATSAPGQH